MATTQAPRPAETRWQQVAGAVKARWTRLTDEDLAGVRGNADRLIEALRVRYGLPRGEAMRQLDNWSRSLRQLPQQGQ
jgi:uncharacterized protein YjbJ (UPF0337 family)